MNKLIIILLTLSFISQADQGITSSTHEKYKGQIVFAGSMDAIAFKKEKPEQFKNQFKASENIYARLYLAHSVGETLHEGHRSDNSALMYDLYIDGKKVNHKKSFGDFLNIPKNEQTFYIEDISNATQLNQWTSWRVYFLPNENEPQLKYGNVNTNARAFVLALLEQETGTHEIEIKLYARENNNGYKTPIIASGKFILELSQQDKQNIAFKYAPPLPKDEWKESNKVEILKDLKRAFTQEIKKQPVLVGIYGSNWNQGVYSLTGQKYRKIAGWAIFDEPDKDGQVPLTTFNWVSDYIDGQWSPLRFDSHCNGCPDWDVEMQSVKARL